MTDNTGPIRQDAEITAEDAAKPYPTGPTLHPHVIEAAHELMFRAKESGMWDLPPKICVVKPVDGTSSPLIPLEFPTDLWMDKHPAMVMTALATAIETRPTMMDDVRLTNDGGHTFASAQERPRILGALFVAESYAVFSDDLTPRERRRLERWTSRRRLDEHPKARECRNITAVDKDGVRGFIQHVRGSVPEREFTYGIEGTIPDALDRFYSSFARKWDPAP